MPQKAPQIRTWIVMVRAGTSIVYESSGREIEPIHVFERLDLELIAQWLDDARTAERFDVLKLIAEPARLRMLLRRLPAATCARLVDVRTEDLSRLDEDQTLSTVRLRRAFRMSLGV